MRQDSAPTQYHTYGVPSTSHANRESEFEEYDGYSPIARLERRCMFSMHESGDAVHRATSMWATGIEYHTIEARLGTRCSGTDLAREAQRHIAQPECRPKRNSCSEADTTIVSEMIAESKGSIGDRCVLPSDCFCEKVNNPQQAHILPFAAIRLFYDGFGASSQAHICMLASMPTDLSIQVLCLQVSLPL